jgi:hypothetical protein
MKIPPDGGDRVDRSDRLQANLLFHLREVVADEVEDFHGARRLAGSA